MNALVKDLRDVLPHDAVLDRAADRITYACDGQTLHPGRPDVVVLPSSTSEVAAVVRVAARHGVPVVPRGAGTGLAGGALATSGGVLVGTARMSRIVSIDAERLRAVIQPGVVNADLDRAAAAHGLRFAPDPSSQSACTVGGNVAANAGGPHTLRLGVTANHVTGLVIVTADGAVHATGECAQRAGVGADSVNALLVGSEGLLGVVTEISVRLVARAAGVRTLLATYDATGDAARAVAAVIATGAVPAAVEMIDRRALDAVEAHEPLGFDATVAALLLVELEGTEEQLDELVPPVVGALRAAGGRNVRATGDDAERARMWRARKQAGAAVGHLARGFVTHDGVVPPSRLAEALARIDEAARAHGVDVAIVAHAGDGNLHPFVLLQTLDDDELARANAAGRDMLQACLDLGGSLTGEHGIGLEKRGLLERQFDLPTRALFARLRHALDPDERMNPGKVLPSGGRCGEVSRGAVTNVAGGWL